MTKNTRKKAKRQVIPEIPTTLPDDLPVPSTSRNLLPRSRTASIARSASRSVPSSRGSSRQSSVSSILAKDASMPQSVLSDSRPRTPSVSGTFPIQTGSNGTTAVLPANLSTEEQLSRPASNPANDSHSQDPTQPLPSSHSMNPLSNVAEPSGSQLPTSRRDATRDILEQNGWPRRFSFDHMESYAPHTDSEDELGVWSANPPGGMRLISNGIQLFTPSIAQNQYTNEGSSHMQSSSSSLNSQPDFSGMAVTDQGVHHFNHNIRDIDWEFPRNVVHDHVATGTEQNYNMTGLRGEQEGDTDPRSTSDMLSSGVWNENRQRHQFDSAPFQYSDEDPRSAEFAPFNYWALPSGFSSQVASSSTGVGGSSGKRKRSVSLSEDREQEVRIGTSASPPALLTHQGEESQQTKRAELEADEDGEVTRQLLPSDGIEASPSSSRSLQASPITSRKGKGKGKARAEDLEDPQSVIDITTSPFITRQPKSPSPDIRPDLSIGQNTSNSTAGATTSSNPKPSGDPLSSYTCPICFSPPTNATLTPCGHICCGECLFAAVKTTLHRSEMSALGGRGLADARCPVCRATIPGWDGKGGGVIGLKVRAVFSL